MIVVVSAVRSQLFIARQFDTWSLQALQNCGHADWLPVVIAATAAPCHQHRYKI